jgi:hypothetical protein
MLKIEKVDSNYCIIYYIKGTKTPHREDGPAVIWEDEQKEWFYKGARHRLDGPAVIQRDGTEEWWVDGVRHRVDGPAVIIIDGAKEWYLNGVLHREDGPAIIDPDGTKEWWVNGKLHREDGPAQIYCGISFWYLNGVRFPTEEGWFEALPEDSRLKLLYSEHFIGD